MKSLRGYFSILIITCLFLISSNSVMADKGSVSPWPVKLSEDSQRAIIMHNSQEEVLILGTELRGEKETEVLEFIPFPSEPTVKLADGDPFKEIEKLMHEKGIMFISSGVSKGSGGGTAPIEIKLSEKIGLHDVTVIKINDISAFTEWVRGFFSKKGIKITNDLSGFYKNAEDYVNRNINYFVFDYVSLKTEKRSIEPLSYRFKTDKIYYPLKTSNVVGGEGIIDLIFISPGSFAEGKFLHPIVRHVYVSPHFKLSGIGFDLSNSARVYPEEIEMIYPEANDFFSKTKKLYIQAMRYHGSYHFKDDFFFDISKLDRRAYVWKILNFRPERLWENRYYLSPVDDDNKRLTFDFPEIKEIRPEPYKTFVMEHDYFTCLIPANWKLKKDKKEDEKAGIFEIRLTKPDKAKPEDGKRYFFPDPLIYVGYYTGNNNQNKTYESFIMDYEKLVQKRQGSDKSRYEKPKNIRFNGKEAQEHVYEVYQAKPRGPLFTTEYWLKAKFIVVKAKDGFYVLAYKSPKEFYDNYLAIFEEVVKSFKPVGGDSGIDDKVKRTKIDDWVYDSGRNAEEGTSTALQGGGLFDKSAGGTKALPSMRMAIKSVDSGNIGFSAGGAKDINNFRENIKNGYLPIPTDITYEGLFYDYYFDTGQQEKCDKLFCPSYARAITQDPFSGKEEYYLAVGLNSGIKESDFKRKKLNLVVVLDISGSMGSPFNKYYYDRFGNRHELGDFEYSNKTKMRVATESVAALIGHLEDDDRFGVVLFESGAHLAKPLNRVGNTDMQAIKDHILEIYPRGGTQMSAGMKIGTGLFDKYVDANPAEYENRIIFLTDAMPNIGETSETELLGMTKENSENRIYSTFIGIGVDFNTELVEHITKIKGANYYSVHSADQFKERMDNEFEYMVTPLVFDLELRLEADGYDIEKVYGSPEADKATGQIMKINTLFPSKTEGGQTKGGLVLLKLKKTSDNANLKLRTVYEDRNGNVDGSKAEIAFDSKESEFFETTGIRKGVLLSRYADLMKNWIADEKEIYDKDKPISPRVNRKAGIIIPRPYLNKWERQSVPLQISSYYQGLFVDFRKYIKSEMDAVDDDTLVQEIGILDYLIERKPTCDEEIPPVYPDYPPVVKKPAVYLYPQEDSFIEVKVDVNGKFIKTEPEYGTGWSVFVTKEGIIDGKYDYLFWEADLNNLELPDEGWVVKYEDLENWFDTNLLKLGLNEKEKRQFEEYWLARLPKSNYYETKLLSGEFMKQNMDLLVSPEPDTIIRLNFYFRPLSKKIDLTEPVIETPERKGFTVVEWGGILKGDIVPFESKEEAVNLPDEPDGPGKSVGAVSEGFKRFTMDNGYFSCNIPKDWEYSKTDKRKVKKGVYGLQVVGPRMDDAPTLARATFYLNDNIYFNGYNDFIDRNSKDIFGDTKTETDTYGPVEKIKLNGKIVYRFESEIKEYLDLEGKSEDFIMLKEKFYVIPSEKGFHVLHFMSSSSAYSEYLPIFEEIVHSFRGL